MNLRSDQYFVQDENWYAAEERFGNFLTESMESGKKICLVEAGVGFNTPTIIRFPFEKLVRENKIVSLIRLNLDEAGVPETELLALMPIWIKVYEIFLKPSYDSFSYKDVNGIMNKTITTKKGNEEE